MSTLSVFFDNAIAWFEKVTSPSAKTAATQVVDTLNTAKTQAEAALPAIANDMANAALAHIPGGLGTDFAPIADALIDQAIAVLLTKKSAPTPAVSQGA